MTKRFEIRKARLTPVVISHDDWPRPETLVATDVSPQGLFIATDVLDRLEGEVRVSYRLGTSERWEYEAAVVHRQMRRRRTDPRYGGLGLELLDPTERERAEMREMLRRIPPPVPLDAAWLGDDEEARGGNRRRDGRGGGRRREDPPTPRRSWWRRLRILTGAGAPPMVV
jgi:hypothetical protein